MTMFDGYKAGTLFVLEKEMPELPAGTIFELRAPTKKLGSPACGYMTNIWINGNTQGGWAEGTHILPGQLSKNREWFTPIKQLSSSAHIFTVNDIRFKRLENR